MVAVVANHNSEQQLLGRAGDQLAVNRDVVDVPPRAAPGLIRTHSEPYHYGLPGKAAQIHDDLPESAKAAIHPGRLARKRVLTVTAKGRDGAGVAAADDIGSQVLKIAASRDFQNAAVKRATLEFECVKEDKLDAMPVARHLYRNCVQVRICDLGQI